MDKQMQKELIIKTALELLQNVLPTNIMENLDRLNADYDSTDLTDDLDEDRFFYENLPRKRAKIESSNEPVSEPVDNNASLTYFEIVEQEMMLSLPVKKENIMILRHILSDFSEIDATILANLKLQTIDQLTNLLVYALMTNEKSDKTEETLFLESGTVNKALEIMCKIIADKKDIFIHWPNKREIRQNVRLFENFQDYGSFEFNNVFGAIGTIEIQVKPALSNYVTVAESNNTNSTYTPIKWQCSCDTISILQSSSILIPKKENQNKNSYAFKVNPIREKVEAIQSDEIYLVADETLTQFPFLLTPYEKINIHAVEHNKALESKRKVIDNAFTKIQSRFLVLKRIELRNATSICNLIETVGILHNFFMVHHDHLYLDE